MLASLVAQFSSSLSCMCLQSNKSHVLSQPVLAADAACRACSSDCSSILTCDIVGFTAGLCTRHALEFHEKAEGWNLSWACVMQFLTYDLLKSGIMWYEAKSMNRTRS